MGSGSIVSRLDFDQDSYALLGFAVGDGTTGVSAVETQKIVDAIGQTG